MAMGKTARALEPQKPAFESHPSRYNLGLDLTGLILSSLIHIMKVTIPASQNGVKEMTGNMPVTGGSSYGKKWCNSRRKGDQGEGRAPRMFILICFPTVDAI